MSEQLKFIVAELNRAPYNKNYNLISFDKLSGEQLLQHLRYEFIKYIENGNSYYNTRIISILNQLFEIQYLQLYQ